MAGTGAKSAIYLGKQADMTTAAASAKYLLPFKSESINPTIEVNKSTALLNSRTTKYAFEGRKAIAGDIPLESFVYIVGPMFYLALGADAFTASSSDVTYSSHTITPVGVSTSIPYVTLQVQHGGVTGARRDYIGAKVNTLKFSGTVGGIPEIALNFVGYKEDASYSMTYASAVGPSEEPLNFSEMVLSLDGTNYTAKMFSDVSFTINNNLDADDYTIGDSGYRHDLPEGALDITGDFTMELEASGVTEFNKFKNFTTSALYIKLERTSTHRIFIIELPNIKYQTFTHDIGGPGRIQLKGTFLVFQNGATQPITVHAQDGTTAAYFA